MAGEVLTDEGDKRWRAAGELQHVPDESEAEAFGLRLGEEVAARRAAEKA